MWDTLQVTHEGTTDIKRSRINTLTHEYELFTMNQNEIIQDIQKRFTYIVNHLASCHALISSGDHCLLACDFRLTTSKCLTPIAEVSNSSSRPSLEYAITTRETKNGTTH